MGFARVVTRVALTREEGRNASLRTLLPEGVEVVEVPATTTIFRDAGEVEDALAALSQDARVTWLVVTSARAARYAPRAMEIFGPATRVASVGAATSRELERCGVVVALSGHAGAADLAGELNGTVVTIGARETLGELEEILRSRDVVVRALACYETRPRALSREEQRSLQDADVIFVGAPSAWRVLEAFVSDRALLVVPGSTTAREVGERREVMVGWDDRLAERLRAWISSREGPLEGG